jgi:hypothetical protein
MSTADYRSDSMTRWTTFGPVATFAGTLHVGYAGWRSAFLHPAPHAAAQKLRCRDSSIDGHAHFPLGMFLAMSGLNSKRSILGLHSARSPT